MKSIHIFIIFIVVALAQLTIPAQMIFNQEGILKNGTAFKFKTEPIDPSDPFKGKYIYLNYDVRSVASNDTSWSRQEDIYVTIKNDSLGFVKAETVTREIPKTGNYVKAKVDWYNNREGMLFFTFPFNEFYMNETKAYDAEVAHQEAQRDSIPNNTYALVFVRNGEAVLDNVFIDDIPIADFVDK